MGEPENKQIDNETKIINAELTPNNLLKITFDDGESFYFHPDALSDLADDFADDDGIIWPMDEYDNDDLTEDKDKDELEEEPEGEPQKEEIL